MKKVFKKSILILLGFILGSVVCISIGVYAYSYAATDIEYTSGKSVKQAIDDLYTKADFVQKIRAGQALVVESTYLAMQQDECNEEKEGCVCFYINKYTSGTWVPTNTTFSYGPRQNCLIKKIYVYKAFYNAIDLYSDSAIASSAASGKIGFSDSRWRLGNDTVLKCGMEIVCDRPSSFGTMIH